MFSSTIEEQQLLQKFRQNFFYFTNIVNYSEREILIVSLKEYLFMKLLNDIKIFSNLKKRQLHFNHLKQTQLETVMTLNKPPYRPSFNKQSNYLFQEMNELNSFLVSYTSIDYLFIYLFEFITIY